MKNKHSEIAVLLITTILLMSGCWNSQNQTSRTEDNQKQFKNISVSELSQLESDETVQFPSVLQQGSETSCIEIFSEDNFKRYKGDSKWSISSRFAADSRSTSFEEGEKVLVIGKMTVVKDASDTSKTCGIVTGQLFEIMEIRNL